MQSIISQLEAAFRSAIQTAYGVDADPLIAVSANEKFGDYQSNAAMGLSKTLAARGEKTNPRAVAEKIKGALQLGEIASEITIAGPGFINVRLSPAWLEKHLAASAADPRLGIDETASPQTVVVDYSGPNIAKELHVGHLRSTIIGDAIVRVLGFQGHSIIRQNHIGDWGTQFGMLITFLMEDPSFGQGRIEIGDLEDFYRRAKTRFDDDAAFQDKARQTVVKLQGGDAQILDAWRKIVGETRRHYQPIYGRMGVLLTQADERGESFYNPYLADVVKDLRAAGIAAESQGAVVVTTEGFENPLIIEKTGGGYLYATTDLAAIRFRVSQLHAQRIIYTHDSRQAQHFAQVFQVARRAGFAPAEVALEYAPFGTMLGDDGKPFKTRSGGTVKLAELLDEAEERALKIVTEKNPELAESQRNAIAHSIGIGAVKYSDLSKDRTSDYVFSWDKALAMDGNTAPYLQYAYARIRSIFRKGDTDSQTVRGAKLVLRDPYEMALAKQVLRFGEAIGAVARELKPHHLCNYLYELATRFSGFFENCPVLKSEEPLRSSRLALCDLTARTMATGLDLLGIEHPEQM
jgi:arginyl-tRNA synthetase